MGSGIPTVIGFLPGKPAPMKPGAAYRDDADGDTLNGTPIGVQILAFLSGLLIAFLGFKSTWQDFTHINKLSHLERFLETPGKLLQVKVRIDSTGSADDYYPDVLYEYFVDGKSIWGWRLSYEEVPKSKAYWEERLAQYATEAPVKVYYNAAQPKDAIIEKKHEGLFRIWLKMGLGAGFLLVGLVLVVIPLTSWLRRLSASRTQGSS
ncbi:MAG: DUF3592 domain-containing protein [Fibrobacterota bacterium]|nr:DUF3592 domain-containing protein [Fibrobacterota bacterium]